MRPTASGPPEKPRTGLTTFSHAVIHLLVQKRAGELQHFTDVIYNQHREAHKFRLANH